MPLAATTTVAAIPTITTSRGSPNSPQMSGAKTTSATSTSGDPMAMSIAASTAMIAKPVGSAIARRRFPTRGHAAIIGAADTTMRISPSGPRPCPRAAR